MDPTALKAGAPPQPLPTNGTAPHPDAPPRPRPAAKGALRRALEPLASLRLTVVLFVLSLVLVFYGTLAQVDQSNWTVTSTYFRSFFVRIPLEVVLLYINYLPKLYNPEIKEPLFQIGGWIPYPGGWLLGSLLLANLLAAHFVRFKLTWRRSGVLILHAGLIVMMISELITGLWAVEGNMTIETNKSSNYIEYPHSVELAFTRIDPAKPKEDDVIAFRKALLTAGAKIDDAQLPFRIEVNQFFTNSSLEEVKGDQPKANPATAGYGREAVAVEIPEGRGVDQDQKHDIAAAYVTLIDRKTEKTIGTYLTRVVLDEIFSGPQWVRVGDKEYQIALRFARSAPQPYTFHLEKFEHKTYLGVTVPKDFRSHIHLVDPVNGEDRKVQIYMNNPLRYHGETFYQSSWIPDGRGGSLGTVLQVVRNPGWTLPYISCVIVCVGMLIHFGLNLTRFLERRAAQ